MSQITPYIGLGGWTCQEKSEGKLNLIEFESWCQL